MSTVRDRKRASTKSERKVAADLGGRRVFNSGTGLDKCDGRVIGKYRIENKYTESPSYTLNVKDWMILWGHATESLEEPIFHIKMRGEYAGIFSEVVVVTEDWYRAHVIGSSLNAMRLADKPAKSHAIRACNVVREPYLFRLDGKPAGVLKPRTWRLVVLTYALFLSHIPER